MDILFFYSASSRTFSSALNIMCSVKEKNNYSIHFSQLHSNVYFQRDISYSVFIPIFHGINMK